MLADASRDREAMKMLFSPKSRFLNASCVFFRAVSSAGLRVASGLVGEVESKRHWSACPAIRLVSSGIDRVDTTSTFFFFFGGASNSLSESLNVKSIRAPDRFRWLELSLTGVGFGEKKLDITGWFCLDVEAASLDIFAERPRSPKSRVDGGNEYKLDALIRDVARVSDSDFGSHSQLIFCYARCTLHSFLGATARISAHKAALQDFKTLVNQAAGNFFCPRWSSNHRHKS